MFLNTEMRKFWSTSEKTVSKKTLLFFIKLRRGAYIYVWMFKLFKATLSFNDYNVWGVFTVVGLFKGQMSPIQNNIKHFRYIIDLGSFIYTVTIFIW